MSAATAQPAPYDVERVRADFPILQTRMRGKPLAYLDNASSAQKPRAVLDATVELYSQHDGADAAEVASRVNADIAWGIDQAKQVEGMVIQTAAYFSQPVYRDQHLVGWRVRQSMRLESEDAASVSGLLGTLQSKLGVGSMTYKISPEQRAQVEDELIAQAIAAFGERAQLVTESLQRSGYRLVKMDVMTDRTPTPRIRSMAASQEAAAMTAPSIEPGTQVVRVMVSGTIEVLN